MEDHRLLEVWASAVWPSGSICRAFHRLDVRYRGRRSKSSCFLVVLSMVNYDQIVGMASLREQELRPVLVERVGRDETFLSHECFGVTDDGNRSWRGLSISDCLLVGGRASARHQMKGSG